MDVHAWKERDGKPDLAIQVGLAFHSEGRRWRLGLEYDDGRVPLGELHLEDQRSLSLGLFVDLGRVGPP